MLQVKQVTIIGTGLLGTSLALALRSRGFAGAIVGVGRRQEVLDEARAVGCFDNLTVSTAEALEQARLHAEASPHLAVLAAPLGHFREIFEKIAPHDDPDLIVTDVGSTKSSVCELATALLPDPSRFMGSHPMAGSEQQGPGAADAELFEGKPCVVTPNGQASVRTVEVVEMMWRQVGMHVVRMEPGEHDCCVAMVSHLPHAVAALLVRVAMAKGCAALEIASTGFADTTRIASGDPALWVDIFNNNREAVLGSVDRFGEAMREFRDILSRGDDGGMMKLLGGAKQARDEWESER